MDTTVPKVPPAAAAANEAAKTVFQQNDFSIAIHSRKSSDSQFFLIADHTRGAPRDFSSTYQFIPAPETARGSWRARDLFPDAPPDAFGSLITQRSSCAAEQSVPETGPRAPRKQCESSSCPSSLFSPFP